MNWTKEKPTVKGYYWIRPIEWIEGFTGCQIVHVSQLDRHDDQYYYFLEDAPGGSLADRQSAFVAKGTFWTSYSAVKQMDHWFYGPISAPEFAVDEPVKE